MATRNKISPTHMVIGVLAFMERKTFSGQPEDYLPAFKQILEENESLPLSEPIVFLDGPAHVESKKLRGVVETLSKTEVIRQLGPVSPTFVVADKETLRKRARHHYSDEMVAQLQQMARRSEELCPSEGSEPIGGGY